MHPTETTNSHQEYQLLKNILTFPLKIHNFIRNRKITPKGHEDSSDHRQTKTFPFETQTSFSSENLKTI